LVMVVEFENSLDDVLALNMYHYQHSANVRRTRLILQFGPPVIPVVVFLVQILVSGASLASALPWLVFAGIWVLFVPFSLRRGMRKRVAKMVLESQNDGIVGKHRLSLTSKAMTDKTDSGKTKTRWAEVRRIVATNQYVFIYIDANVAHIVPKRAFPDESKYKEFIKTVMRHYEAAIG